jgi:O-antigen/teichoic acid export membrane protein
VSILFRGRKNVQIDSMAVMMDAKLPKTGNPASRAHLFARASEAMVAQVVRRTVRFFFLFFVARKLGPETFGIYALLLAMLETLSLMTGEGLADYLAREIAKAPVLARELYKQVTLLRWLYGLLLAPAAIVLLHFLRYSYEIQRDAAWLFLILFARGPLASSQGLFRAVHHMRLLIWVEALQGIALLGLGGYLLRRQTGLRAVIWAELGATFAAALFAFVLARKFWRNAARIELPWHAIWKATVTFNVFPLITNIYDRIDIVILSVIAGNAAAGLYALPYRVLATLQIIPFGLMAAILPVLASRAPSTNDRQFCLRMATILCVLSMFPALILTLLAKPLVLLVLGKSYEASIPILRVLVWAAVPMFLNYGLNTFLLARDKERAFLWTSSICAIVNIVLNLILIPRFSYYAAAAVTVVTELLLLAQNLVIIRKMFSFIALPKRLLTTALILLTVVIAALAGSMHASPLVVAAAACGVFAFYLYFDGSFKTIFEEVRPGN